MSTISRSCMRCVPVLVILVATGCAGGLIGSKEKKLAYFDSLEQETLARLIKEHPKVEQELAESVGYLVAEQKVVKGPWIAAGSGGTDDLMKKGYSTYLLTDAGVSATATIAVLRAQPYSIE